MADWLKPVAGDGDPGRVVLTIGAQHALDCVLSAVTQKSDVVLADEVTYQGMLCVAGFNPQLELVGTAIRIYFMIE